MSLGASALPLARLNELLEYVTMTSVSQDVSADTNVVYLGDYRSVPKPTTKTPVLPRNRARNDSETPKETAIRFGILAIVAGVVLFAAYQL